MNDQATLKIIGVVLILAGLIFIWKGDQEIPIKGGRILRWFSYPPGYMRWMKWPMGGALIYSGLAILLK